MKQIKTILLAGSVTFLLSACGGGGSSSGRGAPTAPITPTAPIPLPTPIPLPATPTPPSYNTLLDLEFKTLNLDEYWHRLDNYTYTTMTFSNNYYAGTDGDVLIDDYVPASSGSARICDLAPVSTEFTYLCLMIYQSGNMEAHGLNINSSGDVSGNYEFSIGGDISELAEGLANRDLAAAWVTGNVVSNISVSPKKLSSSIQDDDKLKRVEFDAVIPQPLKKQATNNSEIAQKLDEMFDQLMLKDEL